MAYEGSGGNVCTRQRSEVAFEESGGNVSTRQKTHTRQKSREGKGRGGRENCEGIVRGGDTKKKTNRERGVYTPKNPYTQKGVEVRGEGRGEE